MVDYTDTELKAQIDALAAQVATLSTAAEADFKEMDERMTAVEEATLDHEARLDALEGAEPVEPPIEPPIEPPVGEFQWPNASNTGVKPGITLTPSTGLTITINGTVLENKDVNGMITVKAANVIIKNCKCKGILSTSSAATNLQVEDCEVVGTGQLCGIEGKGTFLRCNISGFQNGGRPSGVFAIKACFIHTPKTTAADPHYDGLEIYSATTDGLVEDCTIDYKDTSCVFVSNLWGGHDNIRVNHNKLTGADVLARFEGNKSSAPVTNVSFTNNMCGPSYWQQLDIVQCNPTVTGNTDLAGAPLSKSYLTTNQPN